MAEIVWTDRAQQDLREIVEYIARDSKAYAQSFGLRLRSSVDRLAAFPESGRAIPEDPDSGLREVIVQPYRLLYKIAPNRVVVLTVVHGMRLLEPPT